jgi:riboflavin biosynthesis pyrimidine reductase
VLTHRPGIPGPGHRVVDLVDELIVTYAPRTLGSGGRLLPTNSTWRLIESGVNGDFLCARWRKA